MADQSTNPTKDYSAPLRVWHWGTALLVAGQLLTILFIKVIIDAWSLVPEFQQALSKSGAAITKDQGRELAHIISDRIWDWHIVMGLTLAAFWLLRAVLELRGPSEKRFSTRFMLVFSNYRSALGEDKSKAGEALFAKSTYLAFYILLTVIVSTGLLLTWADDYEFLHRIEHSVMEVHEATMYLIIAYLVVHIVGVVRAELTKDHGLISRMIGGK